MKAATRISDFDDIDDIEHEALLTGSPERSWIWFGLIISLCLHITLCIYFYRTRFQSVDAVFSDVQQPMTFRVKNVDMAQIDKASGDQINPAAKPNPDDTREQQPDEKKSFDKLLQEIQATTAMPDDMSNVLPDKPKVDQADVTSVMNEIERSAAQTLSTNPNATREQSVLNDSSASGRPQPALSGTELATSTIIKRPNTFTSKLPGHRADNMKQYLVEALGINPSQIDARGRGSTKFVVPPRPVAPSASQAEFDAEIQRERSNRRVEVTINTNPQ